MILDLMACFVESSILVKEVFVISFEMVVEFIAKMCFIKLVVEEAAFIIRAKELIIFAKTLVN